MTKIKGLLNRLFNSKFSDILSVLYEKVYLNAYIGIIGTLKFSIKCWYFNVKKGKNCKCFGKIIIFRGYGSQIKIGNNCTFVSDSSRSTASTIFAPVRLKTYNKSAKIIIGNNVGLNGTSIVCRSTTVSIGDGAMIAPNCMIIDSNFHALWPPDSRDINPAFDTDRPVIIGNNSWIGSQCIILKGVEVGENSIIAAGSVVSKSIPSNVIAGGNPIRIIKRFDLL